MKKILGVCMALVMMLSFVACGNDDPEYISGEYPCRSCHGDGQWDCERCNSTGEYKGEKCKSCGGIGSMDSCTHCDDTGMEDAIFKKYSDGRVEFSHYGR